MSQPTLLGLSGSLRQSATNRKLLREAARLFDPASFVEADLNLPLYDGDLEEGEGIPAAVQTLADQIAQADARMQHRAKVAQQFLVREQIIQHGLCFGP